MSKKIKITRKNNGKNRLLIAVVSGVVIALILIFMGMRFYFVGSHSITSLASAVFKTNVSVGNTQKLSDITVSPYVFEYFDIFSKDSSNSNNVIGYGVYEDITKNEDPSFKEILFGMPRNIRLVSFFDKSGIYKGTYLVQPRVSFEKDFNEMLRVANEKDYKYLISHTGLFYKTPNKTALDAERKISNACILMYSHINGKSALYKILPPPGKNNQLSLVRFIKGLRLMDADGHIVDFSKFQNEKVMILTVNPYCGSCLDNFMQFVISIPRNMQLDRFVVISVGKSEKVRNIFNEFKKNANIRCNLIIDTDQKLIGQGKFAIGNLIMLDKGYKVYFNAPIGDLLNDREVMNRIFKWQPYGKIPKYGVGGNKGNNTQP